MKNSFSIFLCIAVSVECFFVSAQNWAPSKTGLTNLDVRSLARLPNGDILAGTVGGVFRSIDNGQNWTIFNDGLSSQAVIMEFASLPSGNVFAFYHTIDNPTIAGKVFRLPPAGTGWQQTDLPSTRTLRMVAADPASEQIYGNL